MKYGESMDCRNPKNLQELLKFSVSQHNHEPNNLSEIDEEKRRFLENVLHSMSVNVIEEFLKAIQVLQNDISSDEEKCNALSLIEDYVDNIDFANSFVKTEGADILINCMTESSKVVQVNAINLVGEVCQNNPFCQQYFFKKGVIKLLIQFLNMADFDIMACALYAISCMVRNYQPALEELQNQNGLKCIVNCCSKKSNRVFVKACFVLASTSSESNSIRDNFLKMDAFNILLQNLHVVDDYDVQVEMILLAMSVLVKSSHCKLNHEERSHLLDILRNIIEKNQNLSQCQEIVSYASSILNDIEKSYS